MTDKGLQNELRSLMKDIGLKEGAHEDDVLKSFMGKKIRADILEDPTNDEMIDEDAPAASSKKKKAAAPAAAAPAQAAKAAKKPAQLIPTAAKPAAISLSRPAKAKVEPQPRNGKAKQEATEEQHASGATAASNAESFPLNKPSLPTAPAPSTLPRDTKTEGLKWHQQAERITLPFPAVAKATAQSKGKKVSLAGSSAAAMAFTVPSSPDDCFTLATERFTQIVAHFETLNAGRSSDSRWLSTVMVSGTLTDKVAGMTLMIQESPLYRMAILDKMLAMAHKQGRRENSMAIDALKDLFVNDLLPPRKLIAFASQPYFKNPKAHVPPTETQLVYWALEDALKTRYLDFLGVLEEGTHDEMAYVKKSRIGCIYELLLACPERERVLLSLLVNKLGDADKKVASKVVYYLTELVTKHPGFKLTLISELEQLLYRSNISKRAQYYAIIFLNQLVFNAGDTELANKLIHVYFLLFKQFIALNKKEHAEDEARNKKKAARKKQREAKKAGTAPVTVNEAPKAYGGSNSVSTKFEVKKAALSAEASDALRSKLLGGLLTGINRALPYASVSALEGAPEASGKVSDANKSGEALVVAQMDMIFNLVHTTAFNTSVQALMLLYQALSRSIAAGSGGPNIDRFYRALYDKLLAPELLMSASRHGLFLNLLYKSLKTDPNPQRLAAFAKRTLQIASQAQPNFVCGVLFLLSEIGKTQKSLHTLMSQPQAKARMVVGADGVTQMEQDDEEEHFVDAPEDGEEPKATTSKTETSAKEEGDFTKVKDIYDPLKRDPQFARAELSCLWEILLLVKHFHPSVVKFATDLASGQPIVYAGDPLRDFTAMNFLDRFVYKNPKQKATSNGPVKPKNFARPESSIPYSMVNTPAFLSRATAGEIGEDDKFYHKYFAAKAIADEKKQVSKEQAPGADATEEEEDAFADDIIEREMKRMDPDSWMEDEDLEDPDMDDESGDDDSDIMSDMGEDMEDGAEDAEDAEEIDEDEEAAPAGSDDEDAEEAAAMAEMEGGGAAAGSDSEVEMSDDEEEDEFTFDDDDSDDDDMDEPSSGKKDRNASVFASAEEFADLLNSANDTGVAVKQSAWEKRSSIESSRDQPKGRHAGGRPRGASAGGKGGKGGDSTGYKSAPAPTRGPKGGKKQGGNFGASGGVPEKPSFKSLKRKSMDGGNGGKGSSSSKKKGASGKGKGKKAKKH